MGLIQKVGTRLLDAARSGHERDGTSDHEQSVKRCAVCARRCGHRIAQAVGVRVASSSFSSVFHSHVYHLLPPLREVWVATLPSICACSMNFIDQVHFGQRKGMKSARNGHISFTPYAANGHNSGISGSPFAENACSEACHLNGRNVSSTIAIARVPRGRALLSRYLQESCPVLKRTTQAPPTAKMRQLVQNAALQDERLGEAAVGLCNRQAEAMHVGDALANREAQTAAAG